MNPPARRLDRTLLVILIAIAALVIIALLVVFTRGGPTALDPSTPEGVVQGYVTAVIDGDEEAAGELLAPELQQECEGFDTVYTDNLRVVLLETTEHSNSADVEVSLVTSYEAGLFGSSSYEQTESFELEKSGDGWAITRVPWSLAVCSGSAGF